MRRLIALFLAFIGGVLTGAHDCHALELTVGAGRTDYAICGGPGCWNQPPLPYSTKLTPFVKELGVSFEHWRTMILDVNRAYVGGSYVHDSYYSPATQTYRPDPGAYTAGMTTRTVGISSEYVYRLRAPDIDWQHEGHSELDLRAGWFTYEQSTHWVYGTGATYAEHGHGITPAAGVDLVYPLTGRLSAMLSYDWFDRVCYKEAPTGRMQTAVLALRWRF